MFRWLQPTLRLSPARLCVNRSKPSDCLDPDYRGCRIMMASGHLLSDAQTSTDATGLVSLTCAGSVSMCSPFMEIGSSSCSSRHGVVNVFNLCKTIVVVIIIIVFVIFAIDSSREQPCPSTTIIYSVYTEPLAPDTTIIYL